MPSLETYRKQAKLLARWHRERNYSIGEKVRLLERYRHLTDAEILEMAMPLTLAQEIVGFHVDFLHGQPPFYASVSRDGACLHLRFVEHPNFTELATREDSLILAMIEVGDVKPLFHEYEARGVEFPQRLVRQPWGGLDFQVRDPDGNDFSFVQRRPPLREHDE